MATFDPFDWIFAVTDNSAHSRGACYCGHKRAPLKPGKVIHLATADRRTLLKYHAWQWDPARRYKNAWRSVEEYVDRCLLFNHGVNQSPCGAGRLRPATETELAKLRLCRACFPDGELARPIIL
jgi:hypothetical protein